MTFKIGDAVFYQGTWGREAPRACTITGIGEKNNETVYDNNLGRWGYADQYRLRGPEKPKDMQFRFRVGPLGLLVDLI